MNKKAFIFTGQTLLALLIIGLLHFAFLYAREVPIDFEKLGIAYLVNFLLALGIFLALLRFAAAKSEYLGFLFLFGSALKFAAYFVILEPLFSQDGDLTKTEFFYFFIPYITCLLVETLALLKLLKQTESQ